MTVTAILQIFLRRWYLVVLALLIGVAGAASAYTLTPSQYEAKVDLLLLPSAQSSGDNGAGNPYLALSSSLDNLGTVAGAQVMSDTTAAQLTSSGARGFYVVARSQDFGAPVMSLTATSPGPRAADALLGVVVAEFERQVARLQLAAGAPRQTMIGTTVVTRTPKPEPLLKSAVRNGIVGGMAGVISGLLMVLLVERRGVKQGARRRRRPTHRRAEVPPPVVEQEVNADRRSFAPVAESPAREGALVPGSSGAGTGTRTAADPA